MAVKKNLSLGLSPCPNDTFIFHALLHGLSSPELNEEYEFQTYMADVEDLNNKALKGELEISKVSLGVLPFILDKYQVMASGGALGWGVGPLLVSRKPLNEAEWESATIAIPGKLTTANMLLSLHGAFKGNRKEMLFSEVMPSVASGKADAGLIIHEGRFTYKKMNLNKIIDFGEWWEAKYSVPLPLGVIVIRRDIQSRLAHQLEEAITESVKYAWKFPEASKAFVRGHAQEMEESVLESHIKTFVTEYSENLGTAGKNAILRILKETSKIEDDVFLDTVVRRLSK